MTASLVMFAVAALCAIAAAVIALRAAPTEAQVYRHRIFATMLAAAALILAGFAFALFRWEAEASLIPSR